ncbi:uncharacterized protein LOC142530109 isoform X2 [Primulina tabacum]|uniref:uncharacterized protein LOC142530109 isoform X2 n=1 Tax=Primulina tabacum TaxID=48773 RepID=UPI003F5AA50E
MLMDKPGTPTKAGSFPVDPTMNHPYYLTPGTSTEINLNHSGASANMTDSCARDSMTSCDPPGQSQSPTTPAAADLHNVLPPHTRYRTHAGIILCLPAQQKRSKTSKSQPIREKQPPKNLASSSQMTDNRSLKPEPGTPTKAGSFPVDPTMNHPYYLTPGTSTEINLNHSGASANMTDSCARDAMTSCEPPGQSQSPTTPAAADLHNVLTPHTRYQTHAGIILCLPAQQKRSKTSKSQPIHKKQQPKNLASSSQMTDNRSRSLKPEPGTPTKAGSFPVDLTMNRPYYPTPGTSTEINLNQSGSSANMTDSCARDSMTSCDPPGQSQSPTTPAAADLHNVLPPHTRYRTHAGIILCLPAQQKRSKTSKSQPIREKQPPKNLASSSQMTDNRSLKPESKIRVRLKELTRDETRCMLMDKARTEVIRYLRD